MARYTINIDCGNDVIGSSHCGDELARILHGLARRCKQDGEPANTILCDSEGNIVGESTYIEPAQSRPRYIQARCPYLSKENAND